MVRESEEMALSGLGPDVCFLVSLTLLIESRVAAKRPLRTEGEGKKPYLHGIVEEFWRGRWEIRTW